MCSSDLVDNEGVGYYQLHYDRVEGLTVEMLERWMYELAPPEGSGKKPTPSSEELEKIMSVLQLSQIDVGDLLKKDDLEDYVTGKINRHLVEQSIDMKTFKAKVGVLNATEYQDRVGIEGITGEMLKWWCHMDENGLLKD